MKRTTSPDKRILRELSRGLEEIINEFGWAGFSESESEAASHGERDGAETEEEETESEERPRRSRFPREEIEIGIDRFISLLIKAKIVHKHKTGRQPSLWQVFATLYGEEHPILEAIDSFEGHIKGYFGFVEYDDMGAAFNDILKVRDSVTKDLEAANV